MHLDFELFEIDEKKFNNKFRCLLALAPIAGYAFRFVVPDNELLKDSVVAILAGTMIYSVFSKELAGDKETNFRWFSIGMLVYGFLLVLLILLE